MAYLCVDRRGEFIADEKPEKGFYEWCGWEDLYSKRTLISIPKGTIKKLIGKEMTWEDEPYEMPLNMFCN